MRHFRKGLFASALLCSSLLASPDTCPNFEGFYVGTAGGIATNSADTRISTSAQTINILGLPETLEIFDESKNTVCQIRPWGELFAGWGRRCSCFYYGARLGVNFSNFSPVAQSSSQYTSPDFGVSVSLDDRLKTEMSTAEWTLDFKPGYVFCRKTMLFGIAGAAFNEEHLKGKSTFVNVDPAALLVINTFTLERDKRSAGVRGGIGVEHMLTRCISLQMQYVYTHYWKLSEAGTEFQEIVGQLLPRSAHFSTRASKQVTSIGLAYYF